jgi:hypothetical protein
MRFGVTVRHVRLLGAGRTWIVRNRGDGFLFWHLYQIPFWRKPIPDIAEIEELLSRNIRGKNVYWAETRVFLADIDLILGASPHSKRSESTMANDPKTGRFVVGDSLTSSNLARGLNRAVPAANIDKRTLSSANLQTGLSRPTSASAATSQAKPTPSGPKPNK